MLCSDVRQAKGGNTLLKQFGFEAKSGADADPHANVDWDSVVSPYSFLRSMLHVFAHWFGPLFIR